MGPRAAGLDAVEYRLWPYRESNFDSAIVARRYAD
jgi:hypothetical protein